MESGIQDLVVYLLGAGVVALVAWVWTLWNSHHALRLKVAEEYLQHRHMSEVREELHALRDLVYRIAIKMEVPIFTEPFR